MKCEICKRECRGKIGIGVHLIKSHTENERQILYMRHITSILPNILACVTLVGAIKFIRSTDNDN